MFVDVIVCDWKGVKKEEEKVANKLEIKGEHAPPKLLYQIP